MTAAIADSALTTDPSRRVTVRPAPRREPPFDDEIPQRHLTLVGPNDRPLPFAPSRRRLIDRRDAFSMQPTGRGQLSDPAWFGRRLLVAILEAMAGRRSPHQLAPHLSHGVFIALLADLDRPVRRAWAQPAVLRSVRVCEPADGVAELSAVVQTGARFRAIAARLEGLDGRWRCVRLQIG
jgi:Family of unknown function (DUF6459)